MTKSTDGLNNDSGNYLGDGKLSFGNFQTQICGAMSMGLLQAQGDIAKTGAELVREFTEEQKDSYKGQGIFLQGGYKASIDAASKQAEQMRLGAYGEFAGAALGFVSVGFQKHNNSWSKEANQLKTAQAKLAQQEKLLDLAHKTPLQLRGASTGANAAATDAKDYQEEVIRNRKAELLTEGASSPRKLAEEVPPGKWQGPPKPQSEKDLFPQKAQKAGGYYNENATDEEVSNRTATRGAHYIEGLDEKAIEGMTPAEREKFIEKINDSIKATETNLNRYTTSVQGQQQFIQEISQMGKQGATGSFQMAQASPTQESKEDEARATLANNSANVASGVVQNASQAKESAVSSTQNAMQSFGRVYDGMRG